MANYAPHYPAVDTGLAGTHLQAGDLVMVSFAAADTGPALKAFRQAGSNRAHLAWSAGPHACPSKEPARHITPEDSLTWRPGALNRALATLPARFTPVSGGRRTESGRAATEPERQHGPSPAPDRSAERGGMWSQFLSWLTR